MRYLLKELIMCVCVYLCMCVFMHVCMFICMYLSMYMRMYECVYVWDGSRHGGKVYAIAEIK